MGTIKYIRQLSYQNILDKIDRSRRRKAKVESYVLLYFQYSSYFILLTDIYAMFVSLEIPLLQ